MKRKLSHVDAKGNPAMVNISAKEPSRRKAVAQAKVWLGKDIMKVLKEKNGSTAKGSVFQTAILAGVMGAKQTSTLIPLCHPLTLDHCEVTIRIEREHLVIEASASIVAKTGVEMEALTGVAVAALTVYDMCKALSHDIRIESICLLEKTGGKSSYKRQA
ncbi:MAG: cyclic pyranopterin monophosphate synthase MoaC [Cyclobacteriaceae bacterium]|nr:cyclic pyranopterin monophosphate synthase MoaC [Cyclobacteriaceae bacterium]